MYNIMSLKTIIILNIKIRMRTERKWDIKTPDGSEGYFVTASCDFKKENYSEFYIRLNICLFICG